MASLLVKPLIQFRLQIPGFGGLMDLSMLDKEEILQIYDRLVRDFSKSDDPISPIGVRDHGLLASAISRQHVGMGGVRKYPDALSNAATLGFGICNDHPFYNGNKRTALVSILVHLDKNKLCLWYVDQNDLYEFMIAVADHGIAEWVSERLEVEIDFRAGEDDSDTEVRMMTKWLTKYAQPVRRGEEQVTYRELRKILRRFGFELRNPGNSFIHVVSNDISGSSRNIDSIPYPGNNRTVEIGVVKRVRERCRLTEENGIDSDVFYGKYWTPVDEFINTYRLALRRLSGE
jgi:prophage maintenance system killer protein